MILLFCLKVVQFHEFFVKQKLNYKQFLALSSDDGLSHES